MASCFTSSIWKWLSWIAFADIDDCQNIVCQNGGSCVDDVAAFRCQCTVGHFGQFCEAGLFGTISLYFAVIFLTHDVNMLLDFVWYFTRCQSLRRCLVPERGHMCQWRQRFSVFLPTGISRPFLSARFATGLRLYPGLFCMNNNSCVASVSSWCPCIVISCSRYVIVHVCRFVCMLSPLAWRHLICLRSIT